MLIHCINARDSLTKIQLVFVNWIFSWWIRGYMYCHNWPPVGYDKSSFADYARRIFGHMGRVEKNCYQRRTARFIQSNIGTLIIRRSENPELYSRHFNLQGVTAPLVAITPIFAISFFGFGLGKRIVARPGQEKLTNIQQFFAGAFSGMCTSFVMAPGERIKCLLQMQVKIFTRKIKKLESKCPRLKLIFIIVFH